MLRMRLEAGPVPAAALLAEFAAAGVSKDRLGRAANRLGVVKSKAGMAVGWHWALPEDIEGGAIADKAPKPKNAPRKLCSVLAPTEN